MRYFAVFLWLVAALTLGVGVQGQPISPSMRAKMGAGNLSATPAFDPEHARVPVPEPSEKVLEHYRTGLAWWCVRMVWELAIPAVIVFTGFSARLRNLAQRWGRNWYFSLCLFFVAAMLIVYAVDLPLHYYLGFVRPHAYGLSNQAFSKWLGDSLKGLGISVGTGVLFLWVPCLLLRRSPRRWWLYAGLGALPISFFVLLIQPVWIDPLFNDFVPIEDHAIEAKIIALAERAGIHGSRVYEVKKSVDTKTVNAYVTGFWGTKRIVLWDTILEKLDERELLFVMGHEMGHYALGHIVKGILCAWALTMAGLYGAHRTLGWILSRAGGRLGFNQISDLAALPLIALVAGGFSDLLSPIGYAYSRHVEHEADRFGLELTHFNHEAAMGFVKLQEENLAMPRPAWFDLILRGTHPSIGDRIDFFNDYRPWETGQTVKYEHYFQPMGVNGEP